jgi:hypothetical protein
VATVDSYAENFGPWQGNAPAGAAVPAGTTGLLPTVAAVDATGVCFAATDAFDAGLGQPKAMRTHKSITRPGTPPRGRLR